MDDYIPVRVLEPEEMMKHGDLCISKEGTGCLAQGCGQSGYKVSRPCSSKKLVLRRKDEKEFQSSSTKPIDPNLLWAISEGIDVRQAE